MENRRGKILISGRCYYDELENVSKALACIGFVPFRVEHFAMTDEFELVGCSPEFEPVDQAMRVPEYRLNIERDGYGNYERASVSAV